MQHASALLHLSHTHADMQRLTTSLNAHGRDTAQHRLLPALKGKKDDPRRIAAFCFDGQVDGPPENDEHATQIGLMRVKAALQHLGNAAVCSDGQVDSPPEVDRVMQTRLMWVNMASMYLGNDGIDVLVSDGASTTAEDHLSSVSDHGQ